jgi:hypothetical protein
MMTRQDKIAIVFGMNGHYYDAIMNAMPTWLTYADDAEFDANFDDWFFSQIGV